MGFAFNLIFTTANSDRLTLGLIQGAPMVPALALLITSVMFCPESPRYHLLKGPNYSPEKAYQMLRRVRNTEVSELNTNPRTSRLIRYIASSSARYLCRP